MQPPSLLSEVPFGAFLAYSPRGTSEVSLQSQRVTLSLIKQDKSPGIAFAVGRLAEEYGKSGLQEFFGDDVTVVPAPTSTPRVEGALWAPLRICEELLLQGLAREILPGVLRLTAVRKSASALPGERPKPAAHLASLGLDTNLALVNPTSITVVDDVVTKGATLLAVASVIHAAFPEARVRCFAFVRTLGFVKEIEAVVDPCVGRITVDSLGNAVREP